MAGQDEPRESKLVFIGKGLDAKALAASFNMCLATEVNLKRKAEALRFAVGDQVSSDLAAIRPPSSHPPPTLLPPCLPPCLPLSLLPPLLPPSLSGRVQD